MSVLDDVNSRGVSAHQAAEAGDDDWSTGYGRNG
jgi:hypothetical protein